MNRLSIKQRVTAFYASILLGLTLLIMLVFYLTLDLQAVSVSRSVLERAVKNAFDSIEMPGQWIEIPDDFDFYVHDVSLVIYGPQGKRILGQVPQGFPEQASLRSDEHRSFQTGEETWRLYDFYHEDAQGNGLWIRGIYSLSHSQMTLKRLAITMVIVLPVLIALALLAGYLVTARAFAPVEQIQKTADRILRDRDLSSRIQLAGNPKNELVKLANTYDVLLDRIERSFNHEKQFASDVSHELRTPVSVILSQAEYALAQDDPQEQKKSLAAIVRQTEQMSQMMSRLLELSRTGHLLTSLKKDCFNLAELCDLVADQLQDEADKRGILLIRKLDDQLMIHADQTLIMRALINLVTNSIQYGKQGGFVMIDLQRTDDELVLAVSDNGVGIAPEHLDKLFNRFYRVDPSRGRDGPDGSGLGLAMVQQIVQAHDGQVEVQSTPGVGSTFTLRFPDNDQVC